MTKNYSFLEQQIVAFGAALNGGNQPQSEYINALSKSFKALETQINIWETFIANGTNVNKDDAMLFSLSVSEQYLHYTHKSTEIEQLRYFYIAQKLQTCSGSTTETIEVKTLKATQVILVVV